MSGIFADPCEKIMEDATKELEALAEMAERKRLLICERHCLLPMTEMAGGDAVSAFFVKDVAIECGVKHEIARYFVTVKSGCTGDERTYETSEWKARKLNKFIRGILKPGAPEKP